ncbi:MAG TPA: hypothetical protein VH370_08010 [Humisphaera sp.]|jgi:hypothetical protein|nr:hypothetical protein [Humisphaera sp.]
MITDLEFTQDRPGYVALRFASDLSGATFYVYRDGQLLRTTTANHFSCRIDPDTAPVFEVFDDPSTAPAALPRSLLLFWYRSDATDYYRIDQYDGSAWNFVTRIPDDGRSTYLWTSPNQPDGQVAQFRIVPVGTNGNEGTPTTIARLIVAHPLPPQVSYSYDAGTGKVTIG